MGSRRGGGGPACPPAPRTADGEMRCSTPCPLLWCCEYPAGSPEARPGVGGGFAVPSTWGGGHPAQGCRPAAGTETVRSRVGNQGSGDEGAAMAAPTRMPQFGPPREQAAPEAQTGLLLKQMKGRARKRRAASRSGRLRPRPDVPLACLGCDHQAAKQWEKKIPTFSQGGLLENLLIRRVGRRSTAILKPPSHHSNVVFKITVPPWPLPWGS